MKVDERLSNREWFLNEHKNKSYTQMAKEIGVHFITVRRWAIRHGIPKKTRDQYRAGKVAQYPLLEDKEWLLDAYQNEKMSTIDIAKIAGCSKGAVTYAMQKHQIPARTFREGKQLSLSKTRHLGADSTHWKGGRIKVGLGYMAIYKPDHPYCNQDGYVMEHRLVMEEKIGRYLNKEELIHHINGNKIDNRPENLEIVSKGGHVTKHFEAIKEVDRLKRILDENKITY